MAESLVPEAVVLGALILVAQDLVGFGALFKFVLGGFVARILVGVELHRELAIRLLDGVAVCRAFDAEHFVVVELSCSHVSVLNLKLACAMHVFSQTMRLKGEVGKVGLVLLLGLLFGDLGVDLGEAFTEVVRIDFVFCVLQRINHDGLREIQLADFLTESS